MATFLKLYYVIADLKINQYALSSVQITLIDKIAAGMLHNTI